MFNLLAEQYSFMKDWQGGDNVIDHYIIQVERNTIGWASEKAERIAQQQYK